MLTKILKELQTLNKNLEFFKNRITKYDNACQKSGKVSVGNNDPNIIKKCMSELSEKIGDEKWIRYCATPKKEKKATAYERAEITAEEIIQFCIEKKIKLDEFNALQDVLPKKIKKHMNYVNSITTLK